MRADRFANEYGPNGMNDTLKSLVGFLDTGKPELQVAAAQVLGELRPKDPTVVRALAAVLHRSPVLGRFGMEALAKIQTAEAVQAIAAMTGEGEVLGEHAAHLLAELGAVVNPVIAASWPEALGEQRQRILAVLAKHVDRDAVPVFVQALSTPDTAAVAARALGNAQLSPALVKQLRDSLHKQLAVPLPDVCVAQIVQLLAAIDASGSRSRLLEFAERPQPAAVRQAALAALRGTPLPAALVRELFDGLEDPEQREVHEAMRLVLEQLPEVPEAMVPVLKRLLQARQPEQRLFALRMLRTTGGAEFGKTCLKLLEHDDVRFREAAGEALAHNRQAIDALLRLLITSKRPEVAASAASVLQRHAEHFPPKFVRELADKSIKSLAGNVRVADLLLDVLFGAHAKKAAAWLLEACVRLRRAHRHADALHVLARLATTPAVDDEVRYQLALTKLLHDAAMPVGDAAAPGNSTMGFLASLVRGGFPLFARLRKESAVTAEILLRVANHFVGAVGAERRFATEVLQHLATRTRGKAGDDARVALRAVGG